MIDDLLRRYEESYSRMDMDGIRKDDRGKYR
jgi:hypothetical protein